MKRRSTFRIALVIALAFAAAALPHAAAAANPCAPAAHPFFFELHALKGNGGTELSIAVFPRTPQCAVPSVLQRIEIRASAERRARVFAHVAAPSGRASIPLRKLARHELLKIRVVIQTVQTVDPQVLRGRTKVVLRPDLSVKLVAPRQALRDASFNLDAQIAEVNGDLGATATLTFTVGTTTTAPITVTVPAGTEKTVSYPITLAPEGAYPLLAALSGVSPRETRTVNDRAGSTVEITSFQLVPSSIVVPSLGGYGAQFNQHVYAAISRGAGVTEDNVKDMEDKIVALGPHFVRVFFHPSAFNDADEMQSFVRSVQLAERAGATINVTWQSGGVADPTGNMVKFANTLAELVKTRGVSHLRWVTVQNEVNSTSITMQQYEQFYRLLDADLRDVGVRDQIRFMGGDLVGTPSPLGQTQVDWFAYMASNMADLLDAWSVHIFWDYWDTAKLVRRLTEVRQIWDALPAGQRKPLYVTEYSPRGIHPAGVPEPGLWDDGTPLAQTNVNAFQHAWFNVLAAKLGYYATSKWDAYFAKYDRGTQAFSMIGAPQEGWPVRPVYNVLKLFTSTTAPGWRVVAVDGSYGNTFVTGFTAPDGRVTVIGLDTDGGLLNAISPTQVTYSLGGLPPDSRFRLLVWNLDGSGQLSPAGTVGSDGAGVLTVTIPLHAVFALTTA